MGGASQALKLKSKSEGAELVVYGLDSAEHHGQIKFKYSGSIDDREI